MGNITIVGLGPGAFGLITIATLDKLKKAGVVLLKTANHPAVEGLKEHNINFASYDHLYSQGADLATVHQLIAQDVVDRAIQGHDVVYAVPGNPLVAEHSVELIRTLAAERHLPVVVLPGVGKYTLDPLVDVMAQLRAPTGCPWDLEQTHVSLRRYMVEEVYEILEAIDARDADNLCEELGDLLLQIVFHARIAEERGEFSIQDVINRVTKKMVRRHPHVFGSTTVRNADDVLVNWDKIKQREKGENRQGVLAGISPGLPSLMRAFKLQGKAAKVGFDWDSIEPIWDKIEEEIAELKEAIASGDAAKIEAELGDTLFAIVNLARRVEVEPETALNGTNNRFIRRFNYIENYVKEHKLRWEELSLAELDALWEQAKGQE